MIAAHHDGWSEGDQEFIHILWALFTNGPPSIVLSFLFGALYLRESSPLGTVWVLPCRNPTERLKRKRKAARWSLKKSYQSLQLLESIARALSISKQTVHFTVLDSEVEVICGPKWYPIRLLPRCPSPRRRRQASIFLRTPRSCHRTSRPPMQSRTMRVVRLLES